MRRRILLFAAAIAALPALPVAAHSPYRQWDVFRQRHLQLLTSRSDLSGDALGDQWVAVLRERLPLSRALVSRARDLIRVASLLKTDQGKLAVLSHADARAMVGGEPPFEDFRPMPLDVIVDSGSHLLVARPDLPVHHGFLIAAALMEDKQTLQVDVPLQGVLGMACHPGAAAFARGEKLQAPSAT